MKTSLDIGTLKNGEKFSLPRDFVTHTLGIMAIRGAGKTVAATVIAEEMCEAGLLFVAFDPVGVWWGLRARVDGSPGYNVLVIGGEKADFPLKKDEGARMAEVVLEVDAPFVIDLSRESKTTWRRFVADFCDRLMEMRPHTPRHIFLEEAPEFVPQRPQGEQRDSLNSIDRLWRLGRNFGYGGTLISQRYATVQKDVLTQCENLFAMRMIGKPDRKTAEEWVAETIPDDRQSMVNSFLDTMSSQANGVGWFLSPEYLKDFRQVKIRARKTIHPGATRGTEEEIRQVNLAPVGELLTQLRDLMSRGQALMGTGKVAKTPAPVIRENRTTEPDPAAEGMRSEVAALRMEVAQLREGNAAMKSAVDGIRKILEPEYKAQQRLFGEIEKVSGNGHGPAAGESRRVGSVAEQARHWARPETTAIQGAAK